MDEHTLLLMEALTPQQKQYVVSTLPSRTKSVTTAYILWAVFGVYYFYLNKPVRNILLWITWCILIGMIWWLIDLFRMKGLVGEYNRKAAEKLIAEARVLYPA